MNKVLVFPGWQSSDYYKLLYKDLEKVEYSTYNGWWFALLTNIRKHKPSVVHLHWVADYLALNNSWSIKFIIKLLISFLDLILVRFFTKTHIVWTIHNMYEHETKHRKIERLLKVLIGKLSRDVIVMGKSGIRLVHEEFKISKSKINVILHGTFEELYPKVQQTKVELRESLNISKTRTVFLITGAVKKYKGVENAVKAFKDLNKSNTHLIVAGKFENGLKYLKNINQSNITFIDKFLSELELVQYYKACDWVITPYYDIFTSGTIPCAIGNRRPVIAPSIGLIPDYISNETGILYSPNNIQSLQLAIDKSLQKDANKFGNYSAQFIDELNWNLIREKIKLLLYK